MGMVTYIAPACSSACTTGAHLCICRPIGGHRSSSSACASLGSSVAGIPQEVIKQRLVTGIYPNFLTAVSKIARTEGLLGFYSGWRPTVARNLPFVVICFCSFAALKQRLWRFMEADVYPNEQRFLRESHAIGRDPQLWVPPVRGGGGAEVLRPPDPRSLPLTNISNREAGGPYRKTFVSDPVESTDRGWI